jgi:hypothetical protein
MKQTAAIVGVVLGLMKTWAAATLVALAPLAAQASVVFNIQQVGADVVITGSGSYNLTAATLLGVGSQDGYVGAVYGSLAVGGPHGYVDAYSLTANAGTTFGSGGYFKGTSDLGDVFGLDATSYGGFITVYTGYLSGTPLSGSTTFANRTFESLGLNVGSYTYAIANDTLTVTVTVSSVPEPSSLALMGLGLAAAGRARRRRC